MAYSLINFDKKFVTHLESVVHTADLEQGRVGMLGDYADGEFNGTFSTELRKLKVVTEADLEIRPILIHNTPEIVKIYNQAGRDQFVVKAGEAARFYYMVEGDIITLSNDAITGTPVKGKYLVPEVGSLKLKVSDTPTITIGANTYNPRFVAEITELGTIGYKNVASTTFEVIKA